jgi:hypothetical protein
MAKYLLLIYGDEETWESMSEAEQRALDEAHIAFRAAGGAAVLDGQQLDAARTSTTLRMDAQGRVSATDGPFVETKEMIGGYYLIDVADRDEAIALTMRLREVHAGHSGVEIRPIFQHE